MGIGHCRWGACRYEYALPMRLRGQLGPCTDDPPSDLRKAVWEVFYLPPMDSVFFRCTSTFDARHSLNRFPFAGSVKGLNKKMKSSAVIGWIVKQQLFAFPKSRDVIIHSSQTSAH